MNYQSLINSRLFELQNVIRLTAENSSLEIERAAVIILDSFRLGNKLLICGNGGSAADSQHFAAEFISSFTSGLNRRSLPAISLTTDTSVLTAYSNDYSFGGIFERQVQGLGKPNDVLCVISTSGNSENCLRASETAKKQGLKVIALTKTNSPLSLLADCAIQVESDNTQHIQETHIAIIHLLVEIVEDFYLKLEN
jgi:D-sedoheptulose 7-phosphate isomerase